MLPGTAAGDAPPSADAIAVVTTPTAGSINYPEDAIQTAVMNWGASAVRLNGLEIDCPPFN